jgi:hypothetical protein
MVVLMLLLGACSAPGTDTVGAVTNSVSADAGSIASGEPRPAQTQPVPSEPDGAAPPKVTAAPSGVLANLVGKGLQAAQDRAQDAGFTRLTSHDASGRKRVQILDRDWRVCFQTPAPGRRSRDTRVYFGAVKLGERCPKRDHGDPANLRMPNLRGRSAAAALAALALDASISWRDGSGAGRKLLLPTNWKVCAQKPAPGARLTGAAVTLTVVKLREKC